MRARAGGRVLAVEFEARLLEDAVVLALRPSPASPYWEERERLYEIAAPERREQAFCSLNEKYFAALDLGLPFRRALDEEPFLARSVAACRVAASPTRGEEGAELFVAPAAAEEAAAARERRTIGVRVTPRIFQEPARLLAFLRRELLHVADMLDPAFGYSPELPELAGGLSRLKLVLGRYRVVWDTVVDGRLARRGRGEPGARAARRREFAGTFAMLGEREELAFSRWFDEEHPTHAGLLAFASDPAAATGLPAAGPASLGTCPLCGLPGAIDHAGAAALPAASRAEVQRDFPGWSPPAGACDQCLELYRSRGLSRRAWGALPGQATRGDGGGSGHAS